ncbi:hypothetical protein TNCV_3420091 [Trichonephila clavipes]|nr:hypothetical protein TNCV_3420091 [Trichonephila clavipes]
MFDPSPFVNPTPLAHADTSRDVLPRGGTSQYESFARYYAKNADPRHGNKWIIDLFAAKIQHNNLDMHLKESLIDLSSDEILNFIHPYQDLNFGFS